MKAIVNTRYGSPDVLRLKEVPRPEPGEGEVLVRVHATTVSRTDCGQLRGHPFFIRLLTGLVRPKRTILGTDFAGEVAAVGAGVTSLVPGDRVFGLTPGGYGGHAEYLCMPEKGTIATMPPGVPFDEAVAGEGAWYADTYLKAFGLGPGHKILIYGASGAIGTAAVQLAKSYGAEVTGVVATGHVGLARSLGADRVIDYTTQDFSRVDDRFDFVLDAVGKTTFFRCRKVLKPEGGVRSDRSGALEPEHPSLGLDLDHTEQKDHFSPTADQQGVRRVLGSPHGGRRIPGGGRSQVSPRRSIRRLPLCGDRSEDRHSGHHHRARLG